VSAEIIDQIEMVLDQLRPMIKGHGGDIEFVTFQDDIVYVKFHGACIGCPISTMTLKLGIEEALQEKIPHIKEVIAIE
jgi:Fe-S cluster biogenesis protein NfuA